jgi:hypothetical protein
MPKQAKAAVAEESTEFNAGAFTGTSADVSTDNAETATDVQEKDKKVPAVTDEDALFTGDGDEDADADSDKDEADEQDEETDEEVDEDFDEDEADALAPESDEDIDKDAWKTLATEIGVTEIKSKEELVDILKKERDQIKQLQQEVEVLKNSTQVGERVARLDYLMKLTDEELVKEELKAQGFEGDELEEEFEALVDGGDLSSEARMIRRDLKGARKNAITNAAQEREEAEAAHRKEVETFQKGVWDALSKTDTLLGVKIARTPEEAKRIIGKAFDKYKSGTFAQELTGSFETLAEIILFRELKAEVERRLISKGANGERKRVVVDNLGNAQSAKRGGQVPPRQRRAEEDAFDPKKFLQS